MNAEKCRPLPLGADLYREEYMKTGRVPDETEIRVFMAAVDLIQTDDTMLRLAKKASRATRGGGNSAADKFYNKVKENFYRKWEHAHVPTHAQICAGIQNYMNGGQGYDPR